MNKKLILVLLAIFALMPYINTVRNDFIWDDYNLMLDDYNIKSLKNIPKFFTARYWKYEYLSRKNSYRPLRAVTFTIDYAIWKKNPMGYHITNILLNMFAVLLAFKFAQAVSKSTSFGIVCAVLFASLPVHVETVAWIKNRTEILCFIFMMLSLINFKKYTDGLAQGAQKKQAPYIAGLFFFALALMSKETAAVTPAMMFIILLLSGEPLAWKKIKLSAARVLPAFALLFIYLAYNFTNFTSEIGETTEISIFSNQIFVIPATIVDYFKILVWPFPLNAERMMDIPESIFSPEVIMAVSMLLVSGFILKDELFRQENRYKYGFALIFIFIALIPVSNIFYFPGRPIAEQRLYLPSFGFSYLLALIFIKQEENRNIHEITASLKNMLSLKKYLLVLIILFNASMTFGRNLDWNNPLEFWEKTVRTSPFAGRARVNLAAEYRQKGEFGKAMRILTDLTWIAPKFFIGFESLGMVAGDIGEYDIAIKAYEKALELYSGNLEAINYLGILYNKSGQYGLAVKTFQDGLERYPESAKLHYNLGITYENLKENDKAEQEYRLALKNSENKSFYYNLQAMFYEKENDLDNAVKSYQKAVQVDEDNFEAVYNYGVLLAGMGRYDGALAMFVKASKIKPYYVDNLNNIGIILDITGIKDKAVDMFERAININPSYPQSYYNRGFIYFKDNKPELAKADFQKVLELEPENKGARDYIAKCKVQNAN